MGALESLLQFRCKHAQKSHFAEFGNQFLLVITPFVGGWGDGGGVSMIILSYVSFSNPARSVLNLRPQNVHISLQSF